MNAIRRSDRPVRMTRNTCDSEYRVVVTDDGSETLFSRQFRQTYHSESGAASESRFVFLQNSGIADQLAAGHTASVLEVGFGTGLNFVLTALRALGHETTLRYAAIDNKWIPRNVLEQIDWRPVGVEAKFIEWLIESQCPLRSGEKEVVAKWKNVELTLYSGQAQKLLAEWNQDNRRHLFDAIYHDAFSPEANPELWSTEFLRRLCQIGQPESKFVTYCVKSEIRRNLQMAGFRPEKRPGPPGGKREVLVAAVGGEPLHAKIK